MKVPLRSQSESFVVGGSLAQCADNGREELNFAGGDDDADNGALPLRNEGARCRIRLIAKFLHRLEDESSLLLLDFAAPIDDTIDGTA